MQQGHFYFISDEYYNIFDPNKKLMQNKESIKGKPHDRPCFFAFPDKNQPHIFWCVPISSKLDKYKTIHDYKIEKQKQKGKRHPKCNTIRFGEVLGQNRAFLIQNIFPVTAKYIQSAYIDKNTGNEVTISPQTEKDIINNANDVLRLAFRGVPILFADVKEIYASLSKRLDISSNDE